MKKTILILIVLLLVAMLVYLSLFNSKSAISKPTPVDSGIPMSDTDKLILQKLSTPSVEKVSETEQKAIQQSLSATSTKKESTLSESDKALLLKQLQGPSVK